MTNEWVAFKKKVVTLQIKVGAMMNALKKMLEI